MDNKKVICLIMSGGAGTRLWPVSREAKPKQYHNLVGEDSLLQSTIKRFVQITGAGNIFVVSGSSQAGILERQAAMLPSGNIIYEPVGRNTLPCIGLAAAIAEHENPNGVMVVSPSDHLIENNELFGKTVHAAVKLVDERNGIVTIGVSPTHPATGYGYIKAGAQINAGSEIRQFAVESFVEKPNLEKATEYIKRGGFYWNSGIFVFRIPVFMNALKEFTPELYNSLKTIQDEMGKPSFNTTLNNVYRSLESISIDYGIMEHAQNIYTVEGNFDWNDLGNWDSVYQTSAKDENGNVLAGEAVAIDCSNSYIKAGSNLVAVAGIDNVIVVCEGNKILVCKRGESENVKKIAECLRSDNKKQFM